MARAEPEMSTFPGGNRGCAQGLTPETGYLGRHAGSPQRHTVGPRQAPTRAGCMSTPRGPGPARLGPGRGREPRYAEPERLGIKNSWRSPSCKPNDPRAGAPGRPGRWP